MVHHLGDERAERRRHGDRRHHRAAGDAAARLRQGHGHGRDPGRQLARHPDPAQRRARPLRHDRPRSRSASSGSPACCPACCWPACSSPTSRSAAGCSRTSARPCPRPSARWAGPRSSGCSAPASSRSSSSSSMMGLFIIGTTSLVESSAVGAAGRDPRCPGQGPPHLRGDGRHASARRSPSAACSCGSSWRRLCFGAVFDGLGAVQARSSGCSWTSWASGPGRCSSLMQLCFHRDGDVPRRHRDAGDRGAALHPAGERAGLRPRSGTASSTRSPARSPT